MKHWIFKLWLYVIDEIIEMNCIYFDDYIIDIYVDDLLIKPYK